MFLIEGRRANAEIREQAEVDLIVEELEGLDYRSMSRGLLAGLCRAASVDPASLSIVHMLSEQSYYRRRRIAGTPAGDLLFRGDQGFLIQPGRQVLRLWCFHNHAVESAMEVFCKDVQEAAQSRLDGRRLRGMDFTWEEIDLDYPTGPVAMIAGPQYRDEDLEVTEPVYNQDEASAARLLVDPAARTFLLRMAQVSKARAIDAEVEESVTDELLESDLIRREYLVTCRDDSHTICTLPARRDVLDSSGAHLKCTCGRPLKDELLREIYALTELGRRLLTGSRWMLIWTTELLLSSGVSREQIWWSPEASGEELDILLKLSGLRVFFELKDRDFGLGDAYPFIYRVSRYGGYLGVVATMDKVAKEAKEFFKEQQRELRGTSISLLEGQNGIRRGVSKLVDDVSQTAVLRLASESFEQAGLNVRPVIERWLETRRRADGA
jgi:hypothetical protein